MSQYDTEIRTCKHNHVYAVVREIGEDGYREQGCPFCGNWQPIKTAPKDGDCIIVYVPRNKHISGFVTQASWDCGMWVYHDVLDGYHECDTEINPTHWQPLPQPPKEIL
jgi:hypothetical protein